MSYQNIFNMISLIIMRKGSGPCLFCGSVVCTKEEQEVLNRGSKKSEQLRKKLMGDDGSRSKRVYLISVETNI